MLARNVADRLRRVLSRTAPSHARTVADSIVSDTQREFFEANGYLILPGFFSKEKMQALKAHLDDLWTSRSEQKRAVIDSYFGLPNAVRTHFRKVDDEVRKHPYKLLDLHLDDEVCAPPSRLFGCCATCWAQSLWSATRCCSSAAANRMRISTLSSCRPRPRT